MLTGEMTDRDLLGWIEMKLNRRIQVLAGLNATDNATFMAIEDDSALIRIGARMDERGSQITDLESLRNNIKLGLRCIDGELPQLNDRPWEEADEDEDGPRAVAEVVAWNIAGVACVVDEREAIAEGDYRYYNATDATSEWQRAAEEYIPGQPDGHDLSHLCSCGKSTCHKCSPDTAEFIGPSSRPCRDCGGKGFYGGDGFSEDTVDCGSCGGCGSVPGEPNY